jgi:transposase
MMNGPTRDRASFPGHIRNYGATDRLDTSMLMRLFPGWLRGERGHCGMVAIPTIEEEDAKRPCRERENLVGERTRIINRLKSDLTRLGIRGFKPQLRKVPQLLQSLRTPEDQPIPPNTLDEMRRDLTRLASLREQIKAIEQARQARLEQAPQTGPNSRAICVIAGRSDATPGLPMLRMKADQSDGRKVSPSRAMPGPPRPDQPR